MGRKGKQHDGSKDGIIAGRNPVREALEARDGRLEKLLVQKGASGATIATIKAAARAAGVPVQNVPVQKLEQVAPGVNHQGVIAIAAPVAYLDVDQLLTDVAPSFDSVKAKKPLLLVLDGIEDPHNFGAILRSAVAAGVDAILVPQKKMAPLNAAAMKTSAGAARHARIARVPRVSETLRQLKERGYWIVGASGQGDQSIWTMDWDRPLAVVIGSEHQGLHPHVEQACDYLVQIPIRGPVESLNASVAAALLVFAAARVRP